LIVPNPSDGSEISGSLGATVEIIESSISTKPLQ
jgi:hypothetical protein